MNRVFLNSAEITNFDNDNDTIQFVEQLLNGKDSDFSYNDKQDSIEFELEDQGLISVNCSDLNESGKLKIFG